MASDVNKASLKRILRGMIRREQMSRADIERLLADTVAEINEMRGAQTAGGTSNGINFNFSAYGLTNIEFADVLNDILDILDDVPRPSSRSYARLA